MIEIRTLTAVSTADLERVAGGYFSGSRYVVEYTNEEGHISFELRLVSLDRPYVKKFEYNDGTLQHYGRVLGEGYSFGAYDEELLVGLLIAEPREWNRSLWVWEFHVVEAYRNKGVGKKLMDRAAGKAGRAGFRTLVCETQTTNVTAIKVYRKLGFNPEGIDISYYSNHDYPDGEIAVFMKRRLESPPTQELEDPSRSI